jgi:DNA-binding NarL/FixJ family response regulator
VERIRALVVDRHRVFAESLATALTAEQDVEAVAAGGLQAAAQLLARAKAVRDPFQVLLADVELEGELPADTPPFDTSAVEVAPADGAHPRRGGGPPGPSPLVGLLQGNYPGLRLIVLATADDAGTAARMLGAGASGWVAKDSSLARLLQVVRGVLRDETHLPPGLLTGVLRELTRDRAGRSEYQQLADALTPRELEVLRCMLAGLGRKAVAERLYLSPHTVRTHMQNVLGKLGVHSTLAAVALARRAGVPPAE